MLECCDHNFRRLNCWLYICFYSEKFVSLHISLLKPFS
jgi:hypothetical protein